MRVIQAGLVTSRMFADHSARVSSPSCRAHCAALSPAAAAMEFDALAPPSSSLSSPPSSLSSPSPLTDASSSSSSREEPQRPTPASKRRRNRKKPCHIAQKERRESVVQELALLEARVRELRLKAGAPSLDEIQETEARALENAQLRSAQETYKLVLASAHSSFSSYTNRQYESPLGRPIDLPANWEQRMSLLEGMREEVVMSAYRYLMERTRQMDPLQETAEESKFYSPEGDYCVVKVDNTPFFDASGPEEVLQAYYEYVQQLEVTLSVASGSVITREGEEIKEDGLSSHRFCTTASGVDVPMEKNSVGFTGTVPSSLGPIHVLVLSVVGKDELYPYRPNERVRNDLSGVVTISRRVGPDGGPPVVTMTRYYHIKVYRTPLLPRSSDAEGLHETIHRIHSNMITEIKWHVERNRQARAALLGKQ